MNQEIEIVRSQKIITLLQHKNGLCKKQQEEMDTKFYSWPTLLSQKIKN